MGEAGAKIIDCTSWDAFIALMRPGNGSPLDPVYRGHAQENWPLVAPSQRSRFEQAKRLPDAKIDGANRSLMGQWKAFRELSKGVPGFDPSRLDDLEIQALARHNGLSSNLLDWTSSPFIAAFFAFAGALDRSNDGAVWGGTLSQRPIYSPQGQVAIWRLSMSADLFDGEELARHLASSKENHWQRVQRGIFTRLSHPDIVDLEEFLRSRGRGGQLTKFRLNASEALKALGDLDRMNINFATLFPDLRGAALQANLATVYLFPGG